MNTKEVLKLAEELHKWQFRNNGITPYIEHPKAVAQILINMNLKNQKKLVQIAYLHDVMENCGINWNDLINEGVDKMVADCVVELTRRNNENYFEYIMRLKKYKNKWVRYVKVADLNHNMSDLKEGSIKDKYRFAKYILDERYKQFYEKKS